MVRRETVLLVGLFVAVSALSTFLGSKYSQNALSSAEERIYGAIEDNRNRIGEIHGMLRQITNNTTAAEEHAKEALAEVKRALKNINNEYLTPKEVNFDVRSVISRDIHGLINKRNSLIEYIWKTKGLPATFPEFILSTKSFDNLTNVNNAYVLRIRMEYGAVSLVKVYYSSSIKAYRSPQDNRKCLILLHQGHDQDLSEAGALDTVQHFLNRGCTVATFFMPLKGPNNSPIITPDGSRIESHDFSALESAEFSPLKFFIEPVIVALNQLLASEVYTTVAMIGISAGGWTTTVAAALDERIQFSFPVAGSYPMYLRHINKHDMGDWEQHHDGLLSIANYPELYLLGALEEGRIAANIYNQYDTCCFAGVKSYAFSAQLIAAATEMGINGLSFLVDSTHVGHNISGWARTQMDDLLWGQKSRR